MASDHIDYLDMNMTPPEGSEYWLAGYAQDAFDEFTGHWWGGDDFIGKLFPS